MTNNDIKKLSEAYEVINEISSDRLRSAIRNTEESGFQYDNNRRRSVRDKAGMKDLRDPNLPIICIKSSGKDEVCKFKKVQLKKFLTNLHKSKNLNLYQHLNNLRKNHSFHVF